jgi:hypothetical protein
MVKRLILVSSLALALNVQADAIDDANMYSDDYGPDLRQATIDAVDSGLCTLAQIEDWSWTRSQEYANTWFVYCGEAHVDDRVYYTKSRGFWNDKCTDIVLTYKYIEINGKPVSRTVGQTCEAYRK